VSALSNSEAFFLDIYCTIVLVLHFLVKCDSRKLTCFVCWLVLPIFLSGIDAVQFYDTSTMGKKILSYAPPSLPDLPVHL